MWKPFPLSYFFPAATLEYSPSQVGVQVEGGEDLLIDDDDDDEVDEDVVDAEKYKTYDYIIIGSGTAGSILANRLSDGNEAKKNSKVLVLEAGYRVNDMISSVPLFSILRSNDEKYSYKIKTVEQAGLGGKQVEVLAGRLVGGSSAINAGLYTRGTNRELDEWESKYGCTGWNHSTLEEYFNLPLRHEYSNDQSSPVLTSTDAALPSTAATNSQPSTKRGPWEYSLRKDHLYTITDTILSVLDGKGVKRIDSDPYTSSGEDDKRGPIGSGSFVFQTSISKSGKKIHAGNAYLSDKVLSERRNLKLCTGAKVTKIHLYKQANGSVTAKGVYFEDAKGHLFYARAKSKVILCAGVIHTPQILFLSGIGPKAKLEKLSINPIMIDSPQIGQNVKDHLGVPLHFLIPYSKSSICVSDGIYALPQFLQNVYNYFVKNGKGDFSSPGFMEASAWLNTAEFSYYNNNDDDDNGKDSSSRSSYVRLKCKDPQSSIPNIEFLFSTFWLDWAQTRFKGLDEKSPFSKPPYEKRGIMGIYVILTQPKSKGSISLKSSNPHQSPIIDFQYLQDEIGKDLENLRKGVKFALDVANSLFQSGLEISPADVPGWDYKLGEYTAQGLKLQGDSPFAEPDEIADEVYDDFIESRSNPIYHGCSSCRMGGDDAPVDPVTMKIRGTSNLHVFDASTFPNVPSTHPQSLVFAGAEKVAQGIEKERSL